MDFSLHIRQDSQQSNKKEFDIEPKEGNLATGQFMDITIIFTPKTVKIYDYSLTVDILGE
jgi:hypothetical protein